jgi:hypothetical protein
MVVLAVQHYTKRYGQEIMRQRSRNVQCNTRCFERIGHRAQSSQSLPLTLLPVAYVLDTFISNVHSTGL